MYSLRAVVCLLLVCDALGYACFHNNKDEASPESVPIGVKCDGPCFQCKLVTYNDLDNKQETQTFYGQGCGSGEISIGDTVPVGPLTDMMGERTTSDVCKAMGLGDVEEMTCIDDTEEVVRRTPPNLLPLVPAARPYLKSARVCCCRGDLCNDLTFPEPKAPANQCFSSTSTGAIEAGSVPCDGPCYTLEIAKNHDGQKWDFFAQGCSTDTLQLSSFFPAPALEFFTGDSKSDHSITNICPLLGLHPKDQTVCVSSPKQMLKTLLPRQSLRGNLVEFLGVIEKVLICCCQGVHCNTRPDVGLQQ